MRIVLKHEKLSYEFHRQSERRKVESGKEIIWSCRDRSISNGVI